ncbi:hypothetical protein [Enterobacter sp. CC120223-11]|uniref:hypothetical protein n=1 Tax=Enterobacter sp. CC120223-11 TaxID=1378073 RepID=UPI000BC888AE|nr:hypothetical protein [Enterobacter sp. CC120223-11]SNY69774.1 hypothetical protein SAMN02744775_02209 [Enterobacter sp. CC120223-11]
MARAVEQNEHQLMHARRERDAWQKNRGGSHHYKMASLLVSALEKELSEAISNQANDAHKTADSP